MTQFDAQGRPAADAQDGRYGQAAEQPVRHRLVEAGHADQVDGTTGKRPVQVGQVGQLVLRPEEEREERRRGRPGTNYF